MSKSDISDLTALTSGSLSYSAASAQRPSHLPPLDEPMHVHSSELHTPVVFGSAAAAEISSGSSKAISPSPTPTSGAASVYAISDEASSAGARKSAASESSTPLKVQKINADKSPGSATVMLSLIHI